MTTSRFDLEKPPVDPLREEEDEVTDLPIASKPSGPKLITLPLGIKVTPLQAGLMSAGIIGLIVFSVLRNAPQDTGAPPQFAAQDSVSAPPAPVVPVNEPAYNPPPPTASNNSAELTQPDVAVHADLNSAAMQAIDNVRVYGENNREGLAAVDQRLRSMERRVGELERRLAAAPPPSVATTPTTASKKTPQKSHQTVSGVRGASIASIYPGLAWVTYQGSTWAVQPGDRIGSATVSSIDTEKREVITTAGVIR